MALGPVRKPASTLDKRIPSNIPHQQFWLLLLYNQWRFVTEALAPSSSRQLIFEHGYPLPHKLGKGCRRVSHCCNLGRYAVGHRPEPVNCRAH